MSELTRCNRCSYDDLVRRYGTERVELRNGKDGWVEAWVDGVRKASYMELTDRCAC